MSEEAAKKKKESVAESKKNEIAARADGEESMEEILETIRDVITGEDKSAADDVLDLTQEVSPEAVNANKVVADTAQSEDVLDSIDNALKSDEGKKAEASEEQASEEESPAESSSKEDNADESKAEPDNISAEAGEESAAETHASEEASAVEESSQESAENAAKQSQATAENQNAAPQVKQSEAEAKRPSSLLSEGAMTESTRAMQDLVDHIPKSSSGLAFRSGITMEQLVVEALRPELATWLDEHLPALVKQLVEKEIQRIVPKDE